MFTLKDNEILYLARRRRGTTQREEAARVKLPLREYAALEARTSKDAEALAKAYRSADARRVRDEGPEPHEVALIRRRRAGVSQRDLAARLGCCRWWLSQMEQGEVDPKPLLKHWRIPLSPGA